MYFTANQKKAILFIAVIFLFTIIFHWVDKALNPVGTYDFSQFEEKFYARFDSINAVLQSDSINLNDGAVLAGGFTETTGNSENTNIPLPETSTQFAPKAALAPGQKININTATIAELTLLPRIGPKTAAKIVEYRTLNGNFAAKIDITKVSGIGTKTYQKLKDLITVE